MSYEDELLKLLRPAVERVEFAGVSEMVDVMRVVRGLPVRDGFDMMRAAARDATRGRRVLALVDVDADEGRVAQVILRPSDGADVLRRDLDDARAELDVRAGPIAALRDRSAEVERERDLFRGHLLRMLQRGGVSRHSHAVPGMWDVSNGFPRGGTPCAQCHDDADAREAVGLPRWPGAGAREAQTFTEWPMPAHDVVRLVDAIDSAEGTIAALRDRLAEMEAIIEGRTTPPTDAEIEAHDGAGCGWWLVATENTFEHEMLTPRIRDEWVRVGAERWWPLSDDGRPCAWPVVPAAKEGE